MTLSIKEIDNESFDGNIYHKNNIVNSYSRLWSALNLFQTGSIIEKANRFGSLL